MRHCVGVLMVIFWSGL